MVHYATMIDVLIAVHCFVLLLHAAASAVHYTRETQTSFSELFTDSVERKSLRLLCKNNFDRLNLFGVE